MILTAQEARLLANKNSSGFKKIEEVLQEIQKSAEKGNFSTSYFFCDYYESLYVSKKLKEYGYSVNCDKADKDGYHTMHIWW